MSEAFTGVVVGVDGGPSGQAATELAAETAVRYGQPLCLLHVMQLAPAVGMAAPYAHGVDEWRAASEELLTELADNLRREHPDLTVVTQVVAGNPSGTLIAASESARLLIVGCRGRGGFAELLLGSVSSQVAAHAKSPVIVVRPADAGERPHPGLPVVVGVDGSEISTAAVGFAFAEAATRRVPLVVQHVWWAPDYAAGDGQVDPVALEKQAATIVAEAVAGYADEYPQVAVETRLTHSADAEAEMIDTSAHASLVVVGSRGRGGFRGLLLGSVSQALVHHAECPVAIVRSVPPDRA